jgi:hypothetical protein
MVHPKNPSSLGYMQTCEHLYSNMFHGQNIVHNVGLPYQSENPQQGLGGEEPPGVSWGRIHHGRSCALMSR